MTKVLLGFILTFLAVKYILIYGYHMPSSDLLPKLLNYYRYDCVALGCLMGVLHFNKSKLFLAVNGLHSIGAVVAFYIFIISLTTDSYDYFPFALCFAIIIAYLVNQNDTIKSPRWLIYIGTVSYSLYLTHEIAIVYFINLDLDRKSMPIMYFVSIIFGVLLASLFYFLIEKPFMNIGKRLRP
jgi:peptidoglycan/LPS O-acetylase OafA/YrhL